MEQTAVVETPQMEPAVINVVVEESPVSVIDTTEDADSDVDFAYQRLDSEAETEKPTEEIDISNNAPNPPSQWGITSMIMSLFRRAPSASSLARGMNVSNIPSMEALESPTADQTNVPDGRFFVMVPSKDKTHLRPFPCIDHNPSIGKYDHVYIGIWSVNKTPEGYALDQDYSHKLKFGDRGVELKNGAFVYPFLLFKNSKRDLEDKEFMFVYTFLKEAADGKISKKVKTHLRIGGTEVIFDSTKRFKHVGFNRSDHTFKLLQPKENSRYQLLAKAFKDRFGVAPDETSISNNSNNNVRPHDLYAPSPRRLISELHKLAFLRAIIEISHLYDKLDLINQNSVDTEYVSDLDAFSCAFVNKDALVKAFKDQIEFLTNGEFDAHAKKIAFKYAKESVVENSPKEVPSEQPPVVENDDNNNAPIETPTEVAPVAEPTPIEETSDDEVPELVENFIENNQ